MYGRTCYQTHKTTLLSRKCGLWRNRILQVSFFVPLACSVTVLEFDLTFLKASRSFAVTGKFSTLKHPPLLDGVSNHDG